MRVRQFIFGATMLVLQVPLCGAVESGRLSPQRRSLPPGTRGYVEFREFSTPFSGERFSVPVLTRRAPAASFDYDFCPHPAFNALAYTLVTDPASGWTDYPESFNQPCPLGQAELAAALGEPKFNRNPPADLPWLDPYPWEQFENAARQAKTLKLGGLAVGNWYLQAAYAVRLDVIGGGNEFDEEVARLIGSDRNPALARDSFVLPEIRLAELREQQRDSGVLADISGGDFALGQAWLYRSRGELQAADRWLDEAAADDPELPQGGGLYSFLRSSIELERSYLLEAQRELAEAMSSSTVPQRRQAVTAVVLGEIARRLGELSGAQQWYATARQRQFGEISLDRLAKLEQLVLGRGY